jgi:GNAT superfamily N-acetyltransferase
MDGQMNPTENATTTHPTYLIDPPIANDVLNLLFALAWREHTTTDFRPILSHSLAYVAAFAGDAVIGFVNVAWDGGIHAFLLDTTVHPQWQRRGIGRGLVHAAVMAARARGIHWLHVDYEPQLQPFYAACGFRPTQAGLLWLPTVDAEGTD